MTKMQAAALLNSQTACMLAEMNSMIAANKQREMEGKMLAYDEEAFMSLPVTHTIDWNAAITLLNEATDE